jgi:hypothetical protein
MQHALFSHSEDDGCVVCKRLLHREKPYTLRSGIVAAVDKRQALAKETVFEEEDKTVVPLGHADRVAVRPIEEPCDVTTLCPGENENGRTRAVCVPPVREVCRIVFAELTSVACRLM